jgi:hypothetical protein
VLDAETTYTFTLDARCELPIWSSKRHAFQV